MDIGGHFTKKMDTLPSLEELLCRMPLLFYQLDKKQSSPGSENVQIIAIFSARCPFYRARRRDMKNEQTEYLLHLLAALVDAQEKRNEILKDAEIKRLEAVIRKAYRQRYFSETLQVLGSVVHKGEYRATALENKDE
jgi:hypothetical protein